MIIREANLNDCAAIAKIQVDSYINTYSKILPKTYLSHFTYEEQEQDWYDLILELGNKILYVAELSSEGIIGYALGGTNLDELPPFESELVAIHIHRDFQRHGIGRQLFFSVINGLVNQGNRSTFLWVLADNPACFFYEKLGGKRIKDKSWVNNQFFGTDIKEIAYGWQNIRFTQINKINQKTG